MRLTGLTLLIWLFTSITMSSPQANAAGLADYADQLADPVRQQSALKQILDLADPASLELLKALKEGALYRWQSRLYRFTEEGVFVDLNGKKLLDAVGEPLFPDQGMDEVPLEEANHSVLQRALDSIELYSPEPGKRKSTALRLGNMRDAGLLVMLEKAQAGETDAAVQAVLTEAINKQRLFDPQAQIRLQAVRHFDATRAESAMSLLRQLHQTEPDPQVKLAVTEAIRGIESYLQLRNLVGYLFNGLSLASVLLIMSLGLAVTFGLMGIINMAHGEMLMLGSYTAYVLQELFIAHLPQYLDYYFVLALPLSIVVVGIVGLLMERSILRFLYGRPLESLLITWGIGMILQQAARLFFGDRTSVSPPTWFRGGWEIMAGLVFPYSRLFIILLSVLSLMMLYLLLYRSNLGLKVRSVMQNRDMASCMGISARKVDAYTFALGTALAGLAGCALSLIGTVDPEVGKTYIVDSFMVVVLGGVGKLLGAILASFGIGMSNKILEPLIPGTAAAVYAKVAILVLVIIFLQRNPTGLFPAKERSAAGMLQ
ncbi:MAG: urea ABC transporter permease subunit UrtB [bacterium]|nr:urea ABC transporter permease subunit UrtB [bacterium]